jgi:hypothetical protein
MRRPNVLRRWNTRGPPALQRSTVSFGGMLSGTNDGWGVYVPSSRRGWAVGICGGGGAHSASGSDQGDAQHGIAADDYPSSLRSGGCSPPAVVMFRELDVVVIRALRSASRRVEGTDRVKRQPRIGDQGTVVEVIGPQEYVVESVDDAGLTVWLADFAEDELAAPPQGWQYAVEEISAGAYRATAVGPGGMRARGHGYGPASRNGDLPRVRSAVLEDDFWAGRRITRRCIATCPPCPGGRARRSARARTAPRRPAPRTSSR